MEALARRPLVAALATVAALAVAGCGDDEETDTAAEEPAGDTAAQQAEGGGSTVDIGGVEFAFEPSDPTVDEAGPVTLEFTNDGQIEHALEIEELEESTDTIGAGESTTLETDLEAGEYTIYCPVGDHREQGMEGTLTVAGGGSTGDDSGSGAGDDSGGTGDSGGSGAGY